MFDAKRRPAQLTLPVLCGSITDARRVAAFDERAERLAAALWPGALTIVLPRTDASRDWALGGDHTSVGVRVPHHAMALALLAGGPLGVTSANRSGSPPATTCDELVEAFGDTVEVYLCQDEPLVGVASTVVSLLGPSMEVLRVGDLDPEALQRLSAG